MAESQCPYDFMSQFDDWFYYQKCLHFDKLTHEQAVTNVGMRRSGWVLIPGMTYGGWMYPKYSQLLTELHNLVVGD